MFKSEQEEYNREGVPWKDIAFRDNTGPFLDPDPKGFFFLC